MLEKQRPEDDARRWVAALAAKEEWAWREFVDEFCPRLYAYFCRQFNCGGASAEDLTYESLGRIIQSMPRFNYESRHEFTAWVFAVARNVGVDHIRRVAHEVPLTDWLQVSFGSPCEPEAEAELLCAIHDALQQLPKRLKEIIELRYYCGCSPKEIAEQLNSSYLAIRVSLHRGRRRLAALLGSDPRIAKRLRT